MIDVRKQLAAAVEYAFHHIAIGGTAAAMDRSAGREPLLHGPINPVEFGHLLNATPEWFGYKIIDDANVLRPKRTGLIAARTL